MIGTLECIEDAAVKIRRDEQFDAQGVEQDAWSEYLVAVLTLPRQERPDPKTIHGTCPACGECTVEEWVDEEETGQSLLVEVCWEAGNLCHWGRKLAIC